MTDFEKFCERVRIAESELIDAFAALGRAVKPAIETANEAAEKLARASRTSLMLCAIAMSAQLAADEKPPAAAKPASTKAEKSPEQLRDEKMEIIFNEFGFRLNQKATQPKIGMISRSCSRHPNSRKRPSSTFTT